MTPALEPLYAAAALLLVLSGWAKLRDSSASAQVLSTLGLPAPQVWTRGLGVVELTVGVAAAILAPEVVGPLVAALYALFAVFVAYLLVGGVSTNCGCAGSKEIPPSWFHVSLTAIAALVAIIGSVAPFESLPHILRDIGLVDVVPYIVGLSTLMYGIYVTTTAFSEVLALDARKDEIRINNGREE